METVIAGTYEEMSRTASMLISDAVGQSPSLSLCLATGSTPTSTYGLLAQQARTTPNDFQHLRVIKLDEWGGLPMDDPATCEVYLQQTIIRPLRIARERYIRFESNPPDPEAECQRIQRRLNEAGSIDLCILGLGVNGHLGFNEPADNLTPHPHVATLAQSTMQHPMTQQTTTPIPYGLTLGMANILQARQILLLVSGAHKHELLSRLLAGNITTQFPASLLWLHPDVTIVSDQAAFGNH